MQETALRGQLVKYPKLTLVRIRLLTEVNNVQSRAAQKPFERKLVPLHRCTVANQHRQRSTSSTGGYCAHALIPRGPESISHPVGDDLQVSAEPGFVLLHV